MGTSFVKTNLRSRILQRRRDIVVDFSPKPNHPMTDEEIQKELRRKQSNRMSARKSRLKSKEHEETSKQVLDHETKRRQQLQIVLKQLEAEKEKTFLELINHGVPESKICDALKHLERKQSPTEKESDYPTARQETVTSANILSEESCVSPVSYSSYSIGFVTTTHLNVPSRVPTQTYISETRNDITSGTSNNTCNAITDLFAKEQQSRCPEDGCWTDNEDMLREIDLESLNSISPETVCDIVDAENQHLFFDEPGLNLVTLLNY